MVDSSVECNNVKPVSHKPQSSKATALQQLTNKPNTQLRRFPNVGTSYLAQIDSLTEKNVKQIAILIAESLSPRRLDLDSVSGRESNREMAQLEPAFEEQSLSLSRVPWRQFSKIASKFDAALPLLVWDYFEGNEQEFLTESRIANQHSQILNPLEMIEWNANKRYLDELQSWGAPVIETKLVDLVSQQDCEACFDDFETDELVIKPLVGGGSWRQVRYKRGDEFPAPESLPPSQAMIQPLERGVIEEGEFSFLYFGGEFSHALIKYAATGDYRVQAAYGGTEKTYQPTEAELSASKSILQCLPGIFSSLAKPQQVPLYARVDMIRGNRGDLKLIELELIEPFLYLDHATVSHGINDGAMLLARKLDERLAQHQL